MRTTCIVILHPCFQQTLQVTFGQWNQKVQTFLSQRTNEPLAERIGLGTLRWRLQDPEPQMAYATIELCGENAVPVMNEEAIPMVRGHRFAQLLERP
jgi:hypothetical protein